MRESGAEDLGCGCLMITCCVPLLLLAMVFVCKFVLGTIFHLLGLC